MARMKKIERSSRTFLYAIALIAFVSEVNDNLTKSLGVNASTPVPMDSSTLKSLGLSNEEIDSFLASENYPLGEDLDVIDDTDEYEEYDVEYDIEDIPEIEEFQEPIVEVSGESMLPEEEYDEYELYDEEVVANDPVEISEVDEEDDNEESGVDDEQFLEEEIVFDEPEEPAPGLDEEIVELGGIESDEYEEYEVEDVDYPEVTVVDPVEPNIDAMDDNIVEGDSDEYEEYDVIVEGADEAEGIIEYLNNDVGAINEGSEYDEYDVEEIIVEDLVPEKVEEVPTEEIVTNEDEASQLPSKRVAILEKFSTNSTIPLVLLPKIGQVIGQSPIAVQLFAIGAIGNIAFNVLGFNKNKKDDDDRFDATASDMNTGNDVYEVVSDYEDAGYFDDMEEDYGGGFGRPSAFKPKTSDITTEESIGDESAENKEVKQKKVSKEKPVKKKKERRGFWGRRRKSNDSSSQTYTPSTKEAETPTSSNKMQFPPIFRGKESLRYELSQMHEQVQALTARALTAESAREQLESDCDTAMYQVRYSLPISC